MSDSIVRFGVGDVSALVAEVAALRQERDELKTRNEELEARMDTMGDSTDSRTAPTDDTWSPDEESGERVVSIRRRGGDFSWQTINKWGSLERKWFASVEEMAIVQRLGLCVEAGEAKGTDRSCVGDERKTESEPLATSSILAALAQEK